MYIFPHWFYCRGYCLYQLFILIAAISEQTKYIEPMLE